MTAAATATTLYSTMPSPIGELTLVSDGSALIGIYMTRQRPAPPNDGGMDAAAAVAVLPESVVRADWVRDDHGLREARRQLEAYFAGELELFDLPVAMHGTPFQLRVWEALRSIPFGETVSYAEIARRIGNATAVRAVGAANGRNPVPIVVPCHRVIGADGSLTGYGGGIERKKWLLAHEGRARPSLPDERASDDAAASGPAARSSLSK